MEAFRSLNVHFILSASLMLGSSMAGESGREGDDVCLGCGVEDNPRPEQVTWFRGGSEVMEDVDRGMVLSNLTLVLQRVKYMCSTANIEGSVRSNVLQLVIQCECQCDVMEISVL